MLHLCYSNRLEALAAPLGERIRRSQAESPLPPIHIVAPNRAVEQYIRFQVAQQLGIAANLQFTLLTGFLSDRIKTLKTDVRILDKVGLQTLILARITDPSFVNQHGLDGIRSYLASATDKEAVEARALQLSGELARLYEEYSYSRRGMLRNWRNNQRTLDGEWSRTETWQHRLWSALFDRDGAVRCLGTTPDTGASQLDLFGQAQPSTPKASGTRWMMLIDALEACSDQVDWPSSVHLFGLSYVAPAFAELFALIARDTELNVYALNPCLEFWEDLDTVGLNSLRQEWATQGEQTAIDLDADEDPFALQTAADPAALRLWGRPGREYIRLLNHLSACEFSGLFLDPTTQRDSLLERLQRDILVRQMAEPLSPDLMVDDRSIQILACPGLRREVEIVADQIWSLVAGNDAQSDEAIRFHEIAVMVTDSDRQAYLTHIEAVFRERHGIPFNIIDRDISTQSRVIEAVERLLLLPTSHFDLPSLRTLLVHPAVGGAVSSDLSLWRSWCDQLNIVRGADAGDLAETYIDGDVFHWDQALLRLSLGTLMSGAECEGAGIFQTGQGRWLPLETPMEHRAEVAQFVTLARRLIGDAKASRSARMSLSDWARYLSRLLGHYIHCDGSADEAALSQCISVVERLRDADLDEGQLSFAAVRDLVMRGIRSLDGRQGHYLADGVVVSSLLPMRAIPFKAVFVMGLGEGQFPAQPPRNPLDLRQARRRAGDVTPAERDRYLFLETILAARERIYLSYIARNNGTGEILEPSPVIRELQFVLRGYLDPDAISAMETRFPVEPWDPEYFREEAPLRTVDKHAEPAYAAVCLKASVEAHLGRPINSLPEMYEAMEEAPRSALDVLVRTHKEPVIREWPDRVRLSLSALHGFMVSPLQGWVKTALGLYAREGETEYLDDEPLQTDALTRSIILNQAFWSGNADWAQTQAAYVRGLDLEQLQGKCPVGLFADLQREQDLKVLRNWLSNTGAFDLGPMNDWLKLRIGHGREDQPVHDSLPAIEVPVNTGNGNEVIVEIHGDLIPFHPSGHTALATTTTPKEKFARKKQKHFLKGFLHAAALAAAGRPPAQDFRMIVTGGSKMGTAPLVQRYQIPDPATAKDWLQTLATDLLVSSHAYRMPIEAVFRWKADFDRKGQALFGIYSDENSDRFGPVDEPTSFAVPDSVEAEAMIRRRFGPWFERGGG